MAIKLPKFKLPAMTSGKSRLFMVAAALAGVAVVIFGILQYFGGGATGGGTRVATAPAGLQTVPGAQMSPEFYRAVVQANVQAGKQAQITGGSAVPTLINVPGQQPATFQQQDCTVLCPSDDNVNVADDINALLKDGKLSQDEANLLLDLAKNNVTPDEYAAALNELVRKGKLTPEQARALLNKYKKQYANNLANESGQSMDALIRAGQLPLDTANQLLALQKSSISPEAYAAELNRLVREGKISPETAAQLLAQYTQQQQREQAKQGAFSLQQMAKAGQITPDVANALTALQNRNVPVDQYEAELNRLVREGKMTPAAAARLLAEYKKRRQGIGTAGTLNSILSQAETDAAGVLNDLVRSGKLSKADADAILRAPDCQAAVNKLLQDRKITPEVGQTLSANCKKLAAIRAQAQKLIAMQGNNATYDQYAAELKKAVAAGLLSPQAAATLLDQYRAFIAPAGTAPGVEAALPESAAFAALQQKVTAGTPAAAPTQTQFEEVPVQPPAPTETAEDKQARLQAILTAMSTQAQSLISSWQPAVMQHREGSPATEKKTTITTTESSATGGSSGGGSGGTKMIKPALIKAGTIYFAILETAVDSDYPDTPVMATIVTGPFKGAKILGKLALAPNMDRISLNFSLMDMEGWPTTKSITAFAIDPDTARTVMASSVDYHYLKKYGAIMATAFLQGFSNAITQAGTSTTGIFGTSTTHPSLSGASRIMVGLGQVGTTLGAQIQNYINTPTTVKVNSGVGLGILFMAEVTE